MDNASETLLAKVNPMLAAKIRALADDYQVQYLDDFLTVVQGLRDWKQQDADYAQGRTVPGRIVTNAPAGHSWHEFGLAVDVCPQSLKGLPGWDPANPKWDWLAQRGVVLGLTVGAHFVHVPPDKPHFQLTGAFPASPTDLARNTMSVVGITAVWVEAGLYVIPPSQGEQST